MKKKFVYWGLGALVGGIIAIMISVSLAAPTAPNPGHALSCHTLIKTCGGTADGCLSGPCDYGTRVGGGCRFSMQGRMMWSMPYEDPPGTWYCVGSYAWPSTMDVTVYMICCEAI